MKNKILKKSDKLKDEIMLYRRERALKKKLVEKKLGRKLTDAEYSAGLINGDW